MAPCPFNASSDEVGNCSGTQAVFFDQNTFKKDLQLEDISSAVAQRLQIAQLLLSNNRASEALSLLPPLTADHPSAVEILVLQGKCMSALGNNSGAMAAFAGALYIDNDSVEALMSCAALLKSRDQLDGAVELLERAAKLDPHNKDINKALAVLLTDLGTQCKLSSLGKDWESRYRRALESDPAYAPAHYNLGVAAAEAGNNEQALEYYKTAVRLHPRYAEAWCNTGVIHRAEGRLKEAIDAYEKALDIAPELEIVQLNMAVALTEYATTLKATASGLEQAIHLYERAIALRPRHIEALYNLGVALSEAGHICRAIFMYEIAIALSPTCAEAHNNLGVLYRAQGNPDRAARCYVAALDARPNFPQALNNLAVLHTQAGRAMDALNLLQAALLAAPAYAEAHNNLGVLQRDVGLTPEAIAAYEECLSLDAGNRNAGQNRLLALNYAFHGEDEEVCEAHAAWGKRFEELHPPLPPVIGAGDTTKGTAENPLRVGYVSPDLFTHSVSYFAEAPLTHHSAVRGVQHIVYNCCPRADAKTGYLKERVLQSGGLWRDVTELSEDDLASLVREDRVDVLVELTGHTAHNRLGTLALRPAPVQVTWIGYPNSTGLSRIDYRLTDALCDPLDTKQTFTEELHRLPGCFLCYTPAVDAPDVSILPAVRNGFITFGSFNALAKETPEVLEVWAHILLSIPNARLVLKNKPFACDATRARYWKFFETSGVSKDRIDLLPLAAANVDHLGQYSMIDIGLDPWPYAGTTTTTEALWMGVPVLTLAGKCHAHNVGVSLMTAVGLQDDFVTRSVDAYITRAIKLSGEICMLKELRRGLRERMATSPLCDAPHFVQNLEDVYKKLYEKKVLNQM